MRVRLAAEEEGLDVVFKEAGAEWRHAGCSMCLGMNPDQLAPGERSASTSNRNFEGRQGKGGRTHLVSPLVAAATAVVGTLAAPGRPAAAGRGRRRGGELTWSRSPSTPARAVPLRRRNVDTDQIIPAVYLKRVTRTGFEDGLFAAWRNDPDFVLNRPASQGASILVAGPDFGTGSSREHAVWALQRLRLPGRRLRAVRRHLPRQRRQGRPAHRPASSQPDVERLWDGARGRPGHRGHRRPRSQRTVSWRGDADSASFDIDDYTRWRLLEGLDDVGLTLRHADEIAAYEGRRPSWLPTTV